MTINERIFELMEKKNLRQADLAAKLNVNKTVITAWKKRGNSPPAEMIKDIAAFLGVQIFELLDAEIEIPDNDRELLNNFHLLPEREQIKWIARIEDAAAPYKVRNERSEKCKIIYIEEWKRQNKRTTL